MDSEVTQVDIELPGKHESSTPLGSKFRKPRAKIQLHFEQGDDVWELETPIRVARVLIKDPVRIPCSYDDYLDALRNYEQKSAVSYIGEMLSRRDCSTKECRDKLQQIGFRVDTSEMAVNRCIELGLLDDKRFSTVFIESRKRRGWGKRKIELELRNKGISVDAIEGYPDAFFDADDDLDRCRTLLDRKTVPEKNPREKLIRFLVSKGFDYRIAADAVREKLSQD